MARYDLEGDLEVVTNRWHDGGHNLGVLDTDRRFVNFSNAQFDQTNDSSFHGNHQNQFGVVDCPKVPGPVPPISRIDMPHLFGKNKGIQGHQNSCYLDATLFSMFSFTSVFDGLLFRPSTQDDIQEYVEVQKVLQEEIVNPLRKNFFVRADKVMKLRQLLSNLTSVKGLMSEEKDPEEFLGSLLSQTLHASPFLELSSGQTSHLFQLFVERDESKWMPSVQDLLEQSFLMSGIKLTKVPSVLILQMPRFGRQFKVYDRILPSKLLDVTDLIKDSPRQCIVCCKLATYECIECFGDHSKGLDGTVFCEACLITLHTHFKRQNHKWTKLKVPQEFLIQSDAAINFPTTRIFMELFAVVCIETSHYVTFVKCESGPDARWCFFDSMADRKGDQHGYNIPEVTPAPYISKWLTDEGVKFLNSCRDEKMLPNQAKRLVCDAYMCFYQSPDIMMYQ